MSALERYNGSSLSPWNSTGRAVARDMQGIQRHLWVALAKDAGVAEYTDHEMQNTAALDRKRQSLAGDDEFLNRLLAEEEVSYVLASEAIKRDMYKPWARG